MKLKDKNVVPPEWNDILPEFTDMDVVGWLTFMTGTHGTNDRLVLYDKRGNSFVVICPQGEILRVFKVDKKLWAYVLTQYYNSINCSIINLEKIDKKRIKVFKSSSR